MREDWYHWRLIPLLLLLVFVAGRSDTAVSQQSSAYDGFAQIEGSLSLTLSATPAVSTPGEPLTIQVSVTNQRAEAATPAVTVHLPEGVQLRQTLLPAGLTVNMQTRELSWLPVVPPQGGQQSIVIPARVETADLRQPERTIAVQMMSQAAAAATNDSAPRRAEAAIWVGGPPQIQDVRRPRQVSVGQPFQLEADVAGSGPFTQVWTLGDGRRLNVNDPTIVYPRVGVYQVQVAVSNPLQTAVHTEQINVVPHPAAQFTADDWTPRVGQPVSFLSESGGQGPLTYRWEFGDGTQAVAPAPTHQYNAPGAYLVRLTIQNSYGESEAFAQVTVGEPPAAEIALPPSVPAGQPLVGEASGDGSVETFRWQMGDGGTYEGAVVSHVYRQTGDFYVIMTAENDFGKAEVGQWVHVDPGQLFVYLPLMMGTSGGGETAVDAEADPLGIELEPVPLEGEFVMEPLDLPAGLTPAERLLIYINEARRQFDLPALGEVSALSVAAQQHADEMARFGYTAHTGADGSYPAERLLTFGYRRAYAGEATAWGFEFPYEAVEFWVNSPSHRRIILNRYATDLGVGYTVDYTAPNVWYWTAEFGNASGPADAPALRLARPTGEVEAMESTAVTYGWNWPLPLQEGESFTLYWYDGRQAVPVATTSQPRLGSRYAIALDAHSLDWDPGAYQWQVKLERGDTVLAESETRPMTFLLDPDLPTPTPVVTGTAVPTVTPTPTPTPTATPPWPTATPRPTLPPPPVFPTATPAGGDQ